MDELQAQFNKLRTNYLQNFWDKIIYIKNIENGLLQNDLNINQMSKLYQAVHQISGSSGMFGFMELSNISNKLEEHLKILINNNILLSKENHRSINQLINKLELAYLNANYNPDEGKI